MVSPQSRKCTPSEDLVEINIHASLGSAISISSLPDTLLSGYLHGTSPWWSSTPAFDLFSALGIIYVLVIRSGKAELEF